MRSELVVDGRARNRGIVADLGAREDTREECGRRSVSDRLEVGAAKISVEIFGPDRPVVGKRVFDARAGCPADTCRTRAATEYRAGRGVKDAEVRASAAVSDTARCVDHQAIVRRDHEADAPTRRPEPVEASL